MNDIEKLKILIQKFKLFTETMHKYQDEFKIITQRYQYFKRQNMLPIKNSHYSNCVWSNDDSCKDVKSTDFCNCYYAQKCLKNLCFEIIELIGIEYIINF